MYFKSRAEAGQKLAEQIAPKYQDKPCAVVALSDGGVMVGAQVALQLKCVLTLLLTEPIELPREGVIGGITHGGAFSYNHAYSPGEIEEFVSEYYHLIEQEKMQKMQDMQLSTGRGSLIRKDLLKEHNVILVSDGLSSGFSLDLAVEFLKPVSTSRLIVAVPLASVKAVDRMHVLTDEIFCLSVVEDYISTDHYFDIQDVPPHDLVIHTIEKIVANWNEPLRA